jgi:hypothetical protein
MNRMIKEATVRRYGNHPIFRRIENWTSGRCFEFHCGCDPADGHVGPLVVVCP